MVKKSKFHQVFSFKDKNMSHCEMQGEARHFSKWQSLINCLRWLSLPQDKEQAQLFSLKRPQNMCDRL